MQKKKLTGSEFFLFLCRDGRKIEIKCSSYLQEWERDKLSKPVFSIAKTTSCFQRKVTNYDDQ